MPDLYAGPGVLASVAELKRWGYDPSEYLRKLRPAQGVVDPALSPKVEAFDATLHALLGQSTLAQTAQVEEL